MKNDITFKEEMTWDDILDDFLKNLGSCRLNLTKLSIAPMLPYYLYEMVIRAFGNTDDKFLFLSQKSVAEFTKDVTILYDDRQFKQILKVNHKSIEKDYVDVSRLSILCPYLKKRTKYEFSQEYIYEIYSLIFDTIYQYMTKHSITKLKLLEPKVESSDIKFDDNLDPDFGVDPDAKNDNTTDKDKEDSKDDTSTPDDQNKVSVRSGESSNIVVTPNPDNPDSGFAVDTPDPDIKFDDNLDPDFGVEPERNVLMTFVIPTIKIQY